MEPLLIVAVVVVLFAVAVLLKAVRIVPQARARNVERLGRYHRTLSPGLNVVVPFVDRVYPPIDLREQVVSFPPQPVITEDNLVVEIDTVLYFQVTDPRSASYEIASYLHAVEQLTVTTLRNVVGSMDLEVTLTSRDEINSRLRGVLDDATGRWGLRVNRVEIKSVEPPKSIKDAMEKQMRAERDKRASILGAEGARQSQILTAEGDKQGAILRAEGERAASILRAEGQSRSIDQVFSAVHRNDLDPRVLAYQYLQTLPELAKGEGNTFWVIPSEVTSALSGIAQAFGPGTGGPVTPVPAAADRPPVGAIGQGTASDAARPTDPAPDGALAGTGSASDGAGTNGTAVAGTAPNGAGPHGGAAGEETPVTR
jgi:regulator of protease activity HflC (stomatin/prohibitin superfamily)